MRTLTKVIITLIFVAGWASLSNAQVPNVQIYFEPRLNFTAANCPNAPIGTFTQHVYVVANNFNMFISAIEYRIEYPTILMWIEDDIDPSFLVTGISPDGIEITFPAPQDAFGKILIQKALVLWLCDDCLHPIQDVPVAVRPHPSSGQVRALRWPELELVEVAGYKAWICSSGVPVHETTWGEIKALYK